MFDDKGIIVRKKEQMVQLFGLRNNDFAEVGNNIFFYHPSPVGQAALGFFDLYISGEGDTYRDYFIKQINWLENNAVKYKDAYVYPVPIAIPQFSENKNWVSALYQGFILSSFIRAYRLLKDEKYLNLSDKVFNSYQFKLGEKYGFKYKDDYGIWFEEAPKLPARHILNGYIFSILAIYDYQEITGDSKAKIIWDECIQTLVKALPEYDLGYWSFYDLAGNISAYHYHRDIHIPLLYALHKITDEQLFLDTAIRWERYDNSKLCRFRTKIRKTLTKIKNV